MTRFTPFLCRVTPYGTPFFVPLVTNGGITSILSGLDADSLCRCYWLLERVDIRYQMTFSGSIVLENELSIGGMYATPPIRRLLGVPELNASMIHALYGVYSEGKIDFSTVYAQADQQYAVRFDFTVCNADEPKEESNFLLSLYRSAGASDRRNRCKTRNFSFLGKTYTAYLNYNSSVWADTDISLDSFSLQTVFFENPQEAS
ncbi:MAG: hypothetical protein K2L24_03745 [Opitutales bacterium]|nr:hypothetical protein [Opitutales bacterium]